MKIYKIYNVKSSCRSKEAIFGDLSIFYDYLWPYFDCFSHFWLFWPITKSHQNVSKISLICQQNITKMSAKYHQNVRIVSPKYHQYITKISPKYHQIITLMSPIYHQYVTKISTKCQQNVTNIAPTFLHFCVVKCSYKFTQ